MGGIRDDKERHWRAGCPSTLYGHSKKAAVAVYKKGREPSTHTGAARILALDFQSPDL